MTSGLVEPLWFDFLHGSQIHSVNIFPLLLVGGLLGNKSSRRSLGY